MASQCRSLGLHRNLWAFSPERARARERNRTRFLSFQATCRQHRRYKQVLIDYERLEVSQCALEFVRRTLPLRATAGAKGKSLLHRIISMLSVLSRQERS